MVAPTGWIRRVREEEEAVRVASEKAIKALSNDVRDECEPCQDKPPSDSHWG